MIKDKKLKPITKEEKEQKRPVKKKDIEGFLEKLIKLENKENTINSKLKNK